VYFRRTIIQITIIMNKDNRELYASPEAEVIETQMQTVLCQSNEQLFRENQDW